MEKVRVYPVFFLIPVNSSYLHLSAFICVLFFLCLMRVYPRSPVFLRFISTRGWTEQLINLAAKVFELRLNWRTRLGGTAKLPLVDCGQAPLFAVVGKPHGFDPDDVVSLGGGVFKKTDLNEDGAALEFRAPAGEMKANIDGVGVYQFPSVWVIGPGFEVGPCIGKLGLEKVDDRRDFGRIFQSICLFCRIHSALLPNITERQVGKLRSLKAVPIAWLSQLLGKQPASLDPLD